MSTPCAKPDRLQVDVRILPWEEAENQGERYVYSEFMIWVQDPTFSSSNKENRVTIQTTVPNHRFKRVKLTLLDQNGAPTQVLFSVTRMAWKMGVRTPIG